MKKIIVLFFIVTCLQMQAQVVYEPLHRDVYNFLSRLSQKGTITFNDEIKPLSRKYISEKLSEVSEKLSELTSLEKEELEFFKQDFFYELNLKTDTTKHFSYLGKDDAGRMRLFSYKDDLFTFNLSPILGYSYGKNDGLRNNHFWNGVYFYGYVSDAIGFSFDFRDNSENGKGVDFSKSFTPVTGISSRGHGTNIQYSEGKTTIATGWSWGSFAVGKDFLEWGYGESGKLVLSQKAPSFPFIRLDVQPVSWLRFNYIHAWLASDIVDSNSFYPVYNDGQRFLFRDKFLASHTLTITPLKGLDISLGESIIYSDKLEPVYFFPLAFFRVVDHYLSRQNNSAGSNSQFFFGVSSKNHLKNTHVYSTLFIDEITLSGLFNSEDQRNQMGLTIGGSITDLPINNLTFTTEFTKIFPFVYSHFIPTQTYQSGSYPLGHWMGANADLFYASLNYRILRGLQVKVWGQYIRKGEAGTLIQQYSQPQPPFLFGLRNNFSYFGFSASYEFIHELFAKLDFQQTKNEAQQSDLSFINKSTNQFSFAVYYGL
ncbi:MAG: hypothetical protein IPH11_07115 [Ignavibacteriales bacterium]|nr:hypothetical protein [Ignavibacteriales bacterium]